MYSGEPHKKALSTGMLVGNQDSYLYFTPFTRPRFCISQLALTAISAYDSEDEDPVRVFRMVLSSL